MRLAETRIANVAAWLASACLMGAATVCAYFRIFGQFATYDDEGYILQSVRSYLQGGRLFDEVFTQYGPGFFVLESLIHRTLGAPLTHDVERFITLGVWIATATACAGIAFRLTRSLIVAGWTFVAVAVQLVPIINEPGHPQGPLVLVLAIVILLSTWIRASTWPAGRIAVIGALTAFALLAKVNVGAFIAIGFGLPLLLSAQLPRTRLAPLAVSVAAFVSCAVPLLVTKAHIAGWAFGYGMTISLSLAATIVIIASTRRDELPLVLPCLYAVTTAIAMLVLLVPVLVQGTSPGSLWTGIIVRPSQFATFFQLPLVLPAASVAEAAAALTLAVIYAALVRSGRHPQPVAVALVKLIAVAVGLFGLRAGYGQTIAYVTPLVWTVLLPSSDGDAEDRAFGRGVLAASAVLQALQAYPVAGSQLAFATFLMIPVLFTTGYDALHTLSRALGRSFLLSIGPQFAFVVLGLWLYYPVLDLAPWRAPYDLSYDARLPGTTHVRMPAADVARFQWLSANIAGRCDTLLTLPGLFSLNAWTGVAPPSGSNVTAWTTLLTEPQQEPIWNGVDAARAPCAVYNRALAANWVGTRTRESDTAARKLAARFSSVTEAGGYELLRRPERATAPQSPMPLFLGRQAFARGDTPLPVIASFLQQRQASTVRVWFRTKSPGVVLGCQTQEYVWATSKRAVPMIYVGTSGRLYGQHWTAAAQVMATAQTMNDGVWHHVALVRDAAAQRLYVDGASAGTLIAPIDTEWLTSCQAGAAATADWPDTLRRSNFRGDMEGLVVVAGTAWTATDVAADRRTTMPRD